MLVYSRATPSSGNTSSTRLRCGSCCAPARPSTSISSSAPRTTALSVYSAMPSAMASSSTDSTICVAYKGR